jgi:protein-L-isoaspartate(D-aspartate) O-methyltransferase
MMRDEASMTTEFVQTRRELVLGSAALGAIALSASPLTANVPAPYDWEATPPTDAKKSFIDWMIRDRGEDAGFLGQRWDRFQQLLAQRHIWDEGDKRAFLLTPREEFVTSANLNRAYEDHYLPIGFGVTITDPQTVARMTNSMGVKFGDKVLEIGTGSGYQSAYLSNLTDMVWSIEIIKPLAQRTWGLYDSLIARGYSEYKSVRTRHADGYDGWEEEAPFDKIIVTCGIDHIPPPLLQQLKPGGIMVIPVGPPGAQHLLKVVKEQAPDGAMSVVRSDIYNGRSVRFVPFTKLEGDVIKGTHRAR